MPTSRKWPRSLRHRRGPWRRRPAGGARGGREIRKPTVAAISGYALGGGLEIALGADRRIVGDNAKLGVPEILLGVIPGGGGTQRLARLIGSSRAKDLVFTGRFVEAEEALAIGLVDEVVAPDDVQAAARAGPRSSPPARRGRWPQRRP